MTYRLRVTETAKKELGRLPGYVHQRARHILNSLAHDPRPSEAKELKDMPGRYRIRLVKWRVIYRVDDDDQGCTGVARAAQDWACDLRRHRVAASSRACVWVGCMVYLLRVNTGTRRKPQEGIP